MFTFAEVAAHYRGSALRCETELSGVVETIVQRAAVLARGYIGHQQDDWAPLSGATIDGFRHPLAGWVVGKEDRGFEGPDFDPLLGDTRELRDSISAEAAGLVGIVGSAIKRGLYQEMGTADAMYPIPPRPFLSKALMVAEVAVEELAGDVAVSLLVP